MENSVEEAVLKAVEDADWLQDTDSAAVSLALVVSWWLDYSDELHEGGHLTLEEWSGVGYLTSVLSPVMKALGFSPADRKEIAKIAKTPGAGGCGGGRDGLLRSFDSSVAVMHWKTDFDEPYIRSTRKSIENIDVLIQDYEPGGVAPRDVTKVLYQVRNILKSLSDLGLTPEGRKAVIGDVKDESVSPLDELKRRRMARQAEGKVKKVG